MLNPRDNRFIVCVTLALVTHGLFLLMPIKQKKVKETAAPGPTLKVRFAKPPNSAPKRYEETLPTDFIPETVDVEQQDPTLEHKEIAVAEPEQANLLPKSLPMQTDIIAAVRSELTNTKPQYRDFSLRDFTDELPNTELMGARPPPIEELLTPTTQGYTLSQAGQSTEVIQNQKGEAYCWQQRGIHGEEPQWYRVPLALCGHLQ